LNQINLLKEFPPQTIDTINTLNNMQTESDELQSRAGTKKEVDMYVSRERKGTEGDLSSENGTSRKIIRARTSSNGRKIMVMKENNNNDSISPFMQEGLVGLPSLIKEGKIFFSSLKFSTPKQNQLQIQLH